MMLKVIRVKTTFKGVPLTLAGSTGDLPRPHSCVQKKYTFHDRRVLKISYFTLSELYRQLYTSDMSIHHGPESQGWEFRSA